MTHWRQGLTRAWLHRGVVAALLWPVSQVFALLVAVRQCLYRQGWLTRHRLSVPVVVVGNVMAGGVGKTPLVLALVQHLQQRGIRVGVVSRGYGRQSRQTCAVTRDSTAAEVGDEPLLLFQKLQSPVWVGADRVATAQAMLMRHPELQCVLSDDGLQHLALARDLELCVFDERGSGNGWLLPAGPLREPWPRRELPGVPCWQIRSAGQALPGQFALTRRLATLARRADGTERPLADWRQQPVQALAGIAKPQAFFDMLRAQGLTLTHTQALPDHAPMHDLVLDPTQGDVLCTEKDAVKLSPHHPQVWAVPLAVELPADLQHALDAWLDAKLSLPHGHQIA